MLDTASGDAERLYVRLGWQLAGVVPGYVAAFKDDLAPYEVNNKGTIRLPLSEPVPVKLIERIAKLRAKEVAEHTKAKTAAKKL